MAGVKISQLQDGGALQSTDAFPVARGSFTRKILGAELLTPANFNTANTPTINLNWNSTTRTLSADVTTAVKEASAFNVVDSPTIDLNWNASTRTLSAEVKDASVTNAKIAFDGGSFCFRNKIINGNFDIWQRGTTFTGIGPGTFTADRWTTSSTTATLNKNISIQTLSDLDLPATEAGLKYFLRGSYASGTNIREWAICNPIELTTTGAASPFKVGKTYTLSYYARCASPNNIAIAIHYRDASNSATNEVIVGGVSSQAITTSWTRYTYTFAMVSPNATNTSLCIVFASHTTPANTNIDITGVQLEEGSVATPFEHRPIGTELALCQRYYEIISRSHNTNIGAVIGYWAASFGFKATKRAIPTITDNVQSNGSISKGISQGGVTYNSALNSGTYYYVSLSTASAEL